MYLIHSLDEGQLLDILKDKYLKSSKVTKNVRMFGHPRGSKYIYVRLGKKKDFATLYLDSELLLEQNFYLNIGWKVNPTSSVIKGNNLNKTKLEDLLSDFNKRVNNYIHSFMRPKGLDVVMMSNEILLTKQVSLKKFLVKVAVAVENDKIIDYLKAEYPNVKIYLKGVLI